MISKLLDKLRGKNSKPCDIKRMPKDTYLKISSYFKEQDIKGEDVIIVCLGTNRTDTVDCLAPFVGSLLKEDREFKISVYGTMVKPIHALNLTESITKIKNMNPNSTIIAIDASLGKEDRIGRITVSNKPIMPRAGVEDGYEGVGDYSIKGCVAPVGTNVIEYGGDLSFISSLAHVIAKGIKESFS